MANPRKTIYTLDVDNYEPRIKELTYPLLNNYAVKIGAELEHITTRTHSTAWPVTIEKFQVAPRARSNKDDWSIFLDADTLVSPEMFDPTEHMHMDTVAHNGRDMVGTRWTYDEYFRRDGRHISSCTWCVISSSWCTQDLWRLPDLTPEETYDRINITVQEHNSGNCKREHLIDDYTLSRNIARFGLKFTTITDICAGLGWKGPDGRGHSAFLWHVYTKTTEQKIHDMLGVLSTPQNTPAFPFGIPGELVQGPQGPMLKTSKQSVYGPAGKLLGPCGAGWALVEPSYAADCLKRWGM